MSVKRWKERSARTITLYHGTAHRFDGFSEASIGRGEEGNAALGVHLTGNLALAANYAELAMQDRGAVEPQILVVEVPIAKAMAVYDRGQFFGINHDAGVWRSKEDFAEVRRSLMAQGYDAVTTDVDEDNDIHDTWVILDPARIAVVGVMTVAEAKARADAEAEAEVDCGAPPKYAGIAFGGESDLFPDLYDDPDEPDL